jgi:hypothetical protein
MNRERTEDLIEKRARLDGHYAIAYALLVLTKATHALAEEVRAIGSETRGLVPVAEMDDGK